MLLRDLDLANARSQRIGTDLKMLACMVSKGNSKAIEKAEQIIAGVPKRPGEEAMNGILRMADEITRAEDLQDKELTSEVFREVWGDLDYDSRGSAVLEEMIRRFKKHTGQPVAEDQDERR
jgi:hypothetical protein